MFFSKKTLPADWTQASPVHGLLRASLHRDKDDRSPVQHLELRCDDQVIVLDTASVSAQDPTVPVTVHTHLLPDGNHKFSLALRTAQGEWSTDVVSLQVSNPGPLAERVRESLRRNGVPLAFAGACDSSRYDYGDTALQPWFDRPDADAHIQRLRDGGQVDEDEATLLRDFVRDGFLALPDVLSSDLVLRAQADLARAVEEGYQDYRWGESTRLEQMHARFPAIREIWLLPRIHRLLGLLFDEVSEPCQSLVYLFGSQQDAHQDTIHLTPFPAGYMCGVWVALEDVQPGSGELMVYPGSHRLPRVYLKDTDCPKVRDDWTQFGDTVVKRWGELVSAAGIQPRPYLATQGSVLIWHENLMHAGSLRRDKSLSRRSVVTHNFARGSLVYYDSTGTVGYSYDRQQFA